MVSGDIKNQDSFPKVNLDCENRGHNHNMRVKIMEFWGKFSHIFETGNQTRNSSSQRKS